jgi:hypothetical protein
MHGLPAGNANPHRIQAVEYGAKVRSEAALATPTDELAFYRLDVFERRGDDPASALALDHLR